ncbi:MAG: efflux RND transporter permease subunit, partial [Leptospirales bacterium]|nr:efflux RND transporter permease subunit [Leptospirales bacterium]
FIPLLFTDPETRILYFGFALTVIYSLLVSLFFSLTILPALILALLKNAKEEEAELPWPFRRLGARLRGIPSELDRNTRKVTGLRDYFSVARITESYKFLVQRVFGQPRLMLLGAAGLLAAFPFVFWSLPKEYVNPVESNDLEASIDLDSGVHLQHTQEIVRTIEDRIRNHKAVQQVSSKIEKSHATLAIKIHKGSADVEGVIADLRALTDQEKEAFVYYAQSGEGTGARELDVEFFGDDTRALKKIAQETAGTIQSSIRGVDQVVLRFREGKKDFLVYPLKGQARDEPCLCVRGWFNAAPAAFGNHYYQVL